MNGKSINVNRIVVQKGPVRDVALYWNHTQDGTVLNSGWALNWRRFTHRLRGHRDDGAFVRVSASVMNEEDLKPTIEREKAFATQLFASLPASWPVEEKKQSSRPASLLERYWTAGQTE